MTRPVLPNPSTKTEWFFAATVDTRPPFMMAGPGDHDLADSETDTATPDEDDIVSLASYTHESA